MSSIFELMTSVTNDRIQLFYHKDTNSFDTLPVSAIQLKSLNPNERISFKDENNVRFLTYSEIEHEELMLFFVRECVDDKEARKQLFGVLRRKDYVKSFLEKLKELDLYDEFELACGDVYRQMFSEWAEKHGLNFSPLSRRI